MILPIVQPTKSSFVINLKTAKTLGLDLPLKLQAFTDEVIECDRYLLHCGVRP